jgi:transposase, IS5 family
LLASGIDRRAHSRRHTQLGLSQVVLFGLVLPEPERLMEPWLRAVDKALEDEEIVDAVMTVMRRRWQQSARRGRAGTPAEVVLRMLALKHLRDWSYDELEREVTGSPVYRRFCRIDAGKVPDVKTMVRLGQVVDGPTLRQLLHRLVTIAAAVGVTARYPQAVPEAAAHHGAPRAPS